MPIHRPKEDHWVFVAVAVREQELYFFDSFAQRQGWRQDLRVCHPYSVCFFRNDIDLE